MYFRVRLVSESGELVAHPMKAQGSDISTSMIGANGLAWLDVEMTHVDAGAPVPVLVFGPIASETMA